MSLRLYINDAELGANCWTGTHRYVYNTLVAMSETTRDVHLNLHMGRYGLDGEDDKLERLYRQSRVTVRKFSSRFSFHASIPFMVLATRSSVYYKMTGGMNRNLPTTCPVVGLVHDCFRFSHPEGFGVTDAAAERKTMARRLRSHAMTIAVSEVTKSELVRLFNLDPNSITVAPAGAKPVEASDPMMRPSKIREDEPFFLMVNPGRGNKNWQGVFAAFRLLADSVPPGSLPHLVLAGSLCYEETAILQSIADSPSFVQNRVHVLGFVPDAELAWLYRHTLAVVMPSRFEGFGIPAVEAMAHGAPLILSDIPVFREIAGDAAVFVPLDQPGELAENLKAMLPTASTSSKHFSDRGKARAAMYTWSHTATITLDALSKVASN